MRQWMILFGLGLFGLVLTACAPGDAADCQSQAAGQAIRVENAWARTTDMAGMGGEGMSANSSAAYFVIQNCGSSADKLVGVSSDLHGMTGMHTTQTKDGVTMMGEVRQIEIPAGKKVELKPGGYHIMFMGLDQPIKAGSAVNLVLTFEKTGQVKVAVTARNP